MFFISTYTSVGDFGVWYILVVLMYSVEAVGLFLANCHELKNLITSRNHVQIATGNLRVLQPYHILQMS